MTEHERRRSGAPWFWASRELAARWRAVVVLGLLAGAAGGVSIAAIAGARRTDSAFPRFKSATGAPDAIVFGTQVGGHHVDYAPVQRLPEVADAGEFALAPIFGKGYAGRNGRLGALAPADPHLYRTISRPLLEVGRLPNPRRVDEIVVNRTAAAQFGLGVGDRVTIETSNDLNAFYGQARATRGPTIQAHVVGVGDTTMDQVFSADSPGFHRRTKVEVDTVTTPQDVLNLRNVRPLPRALAAFLVLLGIAALGHALITSVRRRRGELAVLRALGFTPRQTAVTIVAQAGTVAVMGLVVGIPLGIVLGRLSWRWVADATPLVFSPPVAIAVILLAIPVTVVVANLLAAGPARHASRLRPATVLRAE